MSDMGNRAVHPAPMHAGKRGQLLAQGCFDHHDDAWRHDFAAWWWDLPDAGDSVYLRHVTSEYPHDETETTEMIVPVAILNEALAKIAAAAGGEGERNG